jgi:hypothetical protein
MLVLGCDAGTCRCRRRRSVWSGENEEMRLGGRTIFRKPFRARPERLTALATSLLNLQRQAGHYSTRADALYTESSPEESRGGGRHAATSLPSPTLHILCEHPLRSAPSSPFLLRMIQIGACLLASSKLHPTFGRGLPLTSLELPLGAHCPCRRPR